MNQAILHSNEFIVKIEFTDDGLKLILRNPHTEIGQDGSFDFGAWQILKATIESIVKTHTPKES
ncbi:MAG TPA: hypothetical protein VEP90_30080 [Methylomirabilota bacterium]|nr:hypothetical protein [Methylomirabilota bacterium]